MCVMVASCIKTMIKNNGGISLSSSGAISQPYFLCGGCTSVKHVKVARHDSELDIN